MNHETLMEEVRKGFAEGASVEARRQALSACRWLVQALESTLGAAATASPPPNASAPSGGPPPPFAPEDRVGQVIEAVIAKFRDRLPPEEASREPMLQIPFVDLSLLR